MRLVRILAGRIFLHYFSPMKKTLLLLPFLLTSPSFAQDGNADRIDQLERQLIVLQSKLDRSIGGAIPADPMGDATGGVAGAQNDIRITNLEEEMRGLRGKLEEKEFENKRLADELERFKKDAAFRLDALEHLSKDSTTKDESPEAGSTEKISDTPPAPAEKKVPEKKLTDKEIKEKMQLSVKDPAEEKTTPANDNEMDGPKGFDTPRDHYNYAFRLLNQNQYDQAETHFRSFTKKYPDDQLVGNAYYWLGETHYIRKDYNGAAEQFRQGFEALPKGAKAGDNLLKLGMSLVALKKKDEACVVLSQVMSKFKTANAKVAAKAETEHKRAECE